MWTVDQIAPIAVDLDFSSSGQGRRSATAIDCDGTRLVNALELVEFDAPATQVYVCSQCGQPHCESGGWVTMRRLGTSVVWTPAWNEMNAGAWESTQYRPPPFIASRGAPCFTAVAWSQLATLAANLPPLPTIQQLDSREAAWLLQWSAPGNVLGTYPARPKLRREAILAVAEGDLAQVADAADAMLTEWCEKPSLVEPVDAGADLVEFYLDVLGAPAWTPIAKGRDTLYLLVAGGPAIRRVAS